MTRSKKLKKIIRARSKKTGERYTAARRQVLEARRPRAPLPSPETKAEAVPARSARGGLSEASALKATGHGLAHWFGVLDAFGAGAKGHTAAARHLYSDHGVPGWHAQGITVAYERARGLRSVNQASTGKFQVSVSRVVPASVDDVAQAIDSRRIRGRWLEGADPALRAALDAAFAGPRPKQVVRKASGDARLRYRWDAAVVEIQVIAKPRGGASVVVVTSGLPDGSLIERRRAQWALALNGLRTYLTR